MKRLKLLIVTVCVSVQGNLIGTLSGHGSWVLNVSFCPDNVHFTSWYDLLLFVTLWLNLYSDHSLTKERSLLALLRYSQWKDISNEPHKIIISFSLGLSFIAAHRQYCYLLAEPLKISLIWNKMCSATKIKLLCIRIFCPEMIFCGGG